MNGIYLQGGGAKGAFQAGVVYRLHEKGVKFNVLAGTSIGAINGYYIYTDNFEKLKETWTNIEPGDEKISGKVIENESVINILKDLKGKNNNVKAYYVNYVEVKGNQIEEVIVDVTKQNKNEGINSVRYSSLLPYRFDEEKTLSEIVKDFNTQRVFGEFKEDLVNGVYDGYKLDGGILNNNLLSPFVNDKVDKLYIVSLNNQYKVPDYILDIYNTEDIQVIKPKTEIKPGNTLRFEKEFCTKLFTEGYEITKNIV
ncbi:patatin-like phospholipase family protein [Caldisalinibacter kiritimatiensis]|uniref:PNPLA domain-containing protein n=1 Tax=Caldisalinibacter kiritimatiensis TaxID=1304284 RepID=R1AQS0_9FIRM|nr:patatin-like phospholipase family protein [Caldisalinibacter kiritimatiensis]EOC99472.1 hypothetical protein L21TH_2477 [Caldisalinibacter kiritimatiensis]